jgi:hypothetical protein
MRTRKTFHLYSDKYERVTLTRKSGNAPMESWCPNCESKVSRLTMAEAAAVSAVTVEAIASMLGEGHLHFEVEPGGRVVICARSLT